MQPGAPSYNTVMGFLSDLAKLADKGLNAVENGAVEKGLAGALDKLESGLDKAIKNAEAAADNVEKQSEKIDDALRKLPE